MLGLPYDARRMLSLAILISSAFTSPFLTIVHDLPHLRFGALNLLHHDPFEAI
uniref:Uncharacterized protein n=1 Tax=Candidatus Kentrum sp. TUN TaxID=2126343 RepID=A0A450ZKR5_9GAMM|nr:MAG: hypothetical protein BECKTUN1418F_GA0071002_102018 [Candidatus Kentron sp. TUN]VFK54405.1 MAG: hypothetical protein BECKTUN1418E_GA0071001_102118 [Candidatus Kentron sp. TUN]VFK55473.1 MAG: hypothetical protein BECKTUN1418D_GA0071000_10337 [Candidatus Kentron sp. TUN]